jgi:hypothetical protein
MTSPSHTDFCDDPGHADPHCVSKVEVLHGVRLWLDGQIGEQSVMFIDARDVPLDKQARADLAARLDRG